MQHAPSRGSSSTDHRGHGHRPTFREAASQGRGQRWRCTDPCLALPLRAVTADLWASVASFVNSVQCFSERPHDSEGVMATGDDADPHICVI